MGNEQAMPIQADGQRLKSGLQPQTRLHHILGKVKLLELNVGSRIFPYKLCRKGISLMDFQN